MGRGKEKNQDTEERKSIWCEGIIYHDKEHSKIGTEEEKNSLKGR
jgi:hypothetical protein